MWSRHSFPLADSTSKSAGKSTESDQGAAYWYRRAADHFSDISGVFNAVAELAYMYRDGRLKGNAVEAYMWFAVVDPSVDQIDPATDADLKRVAMRMSKLEIAEAQHRARLD